MNENPMIGEARREWIKAADEADEATRVAKSAWEVADKAWEKMKILQINNL